MNRINILDKKISDKIAAGEIIESPVSVVKELIENSLDSNASVIEVNIENAGMALIRVIDNGTGIHPEDVERAFLRHATSKIRYEDDLDNIQTFGFRGEALASIASVSSVDLISKPVSENLGKKITVVEGLVEKISDENFTDGTKIEVRDLFFNLPARRKFVKNLNSEKGKISELINRYSLGHPEISFILKCDRETIFDTRGMPDIESRINYIFNRNRNDYCLFDGESESFKVKAVLFNPLITRNNRKMQIFFVNGRLIKSSLLNKLLDETYYTLIPKGRFPAGILNLIIKPDNLDVNIHPAKIEIKILNDKKIKAELLPMLRGTLIDSIDYKNRASEIAIVPETLKDEEPPVLKLEPEVVEKKENQSLNFSYELVSNSASVLDASEETALKETPAFNFSESDSKSSLEVDCGEESGLAMLPISKENDKNVEKTEDTQNSDSAQQVDIETTDKGLDSIEFGPIGTLRPIGQFKNTFILAEAEDSLYIIDQHTVHERVLYEKFFEDQNNKSVEKETLLVPETLNLSALDESVLIKNILILNDLGFVVENFGPRTYLVRAIPFGVKIDNIEEFFSDLLTDLNDNVENSISKIKEAIITTAACKAAIKANYKLKPEDINYLLRELSRTKNPHTCPHGRPIFKKITMNDLYKHFLRGSF